jgi:hypothetical protein
VESLPDEVTKLPTRYVALATDGQRLWLALSGQGGSQLVAREARLRTHGAKLLLEVQGAGKSRSVLKFDGARFVPQD